MVSAIEVVSCDLVTLKWLVSYRCIFLSIEVCSHQDVVSSDLESVVLRDAVMSRPQHDDDRVALGADGGVLK